MTIRLPGFMEEIAPSLPALSNILSTAINPYHEQQAALRKAMLANPQLAQQLADMGPDAVDQIYGRKASKVVPNLPTSLEKQTKDVQRTALAEILALPDTDPIKIDYKARSVGAKTTADLEKIAREALMQKQSIEANDLTINKAKEEVAKKEKAEATMLDIQRRLKVNPMSMDAAAAVKSGKITGEELNILLNLPNFKTKYDDDREDAHRKLVAGLEQQRINAQKEGNRMSEQEYANRLKMTNIGHIAEVTGRDYGTIKDLKENPDLFYQLTAKGYVPPKDPKSQALYETAVALKDYQNKFEDGKLSKAKHEFNSASKTFIGTLNDRTKTPVQKKEAVQMLNNLARQTFAGTTSDVPEYKYDDKSPNNDSGLGGFGKTNSWYRVGGDPEIFGNENYVPSTSGGVAPTSGSKNVPANIPSKPGMMIPSAATSESTGANLGGSNREAAGRTAKDVFEDKRAEALNLETWKTQPKSVIKSALDRMLKSDPANYAATVQALKQANIYP